MSVFDSSNGFGNITPKDNNINRQLLILAMIAIPTAFFVGKRSGESTAQKVVQAIVQQTTPAINPVATVESHTPSNCP